MEKKKKALLTSIAYALMGLWILGAGAYIGSQMIRQHATVAELAAVRAGADGWEKQADLLLSRGKTGLLYVLQDLLSDNPRHHDFRVASAFDKASGVMHAPLGEKEKAAVRKILSIARSKLIDQAEGRKVELSPKESELLGAFAAILRSNVEKAVSGSHSVRIAFDGPRVVSSFNKLAVGEALDADDALYLRNEFEKILDRIDRCIAGEWILLSAEEEKLFSDAADYCDTMPKEGELAYISEAVSGLGKMAGRVNAVPTSGEWKAMRKVLADPRYKSLPAEKLNAWMNEKEVEFTADEKAVLLGVADAYRQRFERSRERLSGLVYRYVVHMQETGERFITYNAVNTTEGRKEAGVFQVVGELWKKTDDRIMILDMITICGTPHEGVRTNIESALVQIGKQSSVNLIPNLERSIMREKVDQYLATETKVRTKVERLRELNETNKTMRITCIKALGRVGGADAIRVLKPLMDDKDTDVSETVRAALGGSASFQ